MMIDYESNAPNMVHLLIRAGNVIGCFSCRSRAENERQDGEIVQSMVVEGVENV